MDVPGFGAGKTIRCHGFSSVNLLSEVALWEIVPFGDIGLGIIVRRAVWQLARDEPGQSLIDKEFERLRLEWMCFLGGER